MPERPLAECTSVYVIGEYRRGTTAMLTAAGAGRRQRAKDKTLYSGRYLAAMT